MNPMFMRYNGKDWDTVALPGPIPYSAAALAASGSTLDCAYRGVNGVVAASMNEFTRQWALMPPMPNAITPTNPALAVMPNGTLVCVFQFGGQLLWSTYSQAAGTWTNAQAITLPDGQWLDGIQTTTLPALVVFNGTLYLFYQLFGTPQPGNLRCATYDGSAWTQVGGKGHDLPGVVPGMSNSPAVAVLGSLIVILYQGYRQNGSLTGALYDGNATWRALPPAIAGAVMSGSPGATMVPASTEGGTEDGTEDEEPPGHANPVLGLRGPSTRTPVPRARWSRSPRPTWRPGRPSTPAPGT